jgi:hypothetical protein
MEQLDIRSLKNAVAGRYAAIRRITHLEPQGDKVFPPTYEGGEYADEPRQVRDKEGKVLTVETVLLDSVQSQANRMELALLHAYDSGRLKMPMLQVDFAGDGRDSILAGNRTHYGAGGAASPVRCDFPRFGRRRHAFPPD